MQASEVRRGIGGLVESKTAPSSHPNLRDWAGLIVLQVCEVSKSSFEMICGVIWDDTNIFSGTNIWGFRYWLVSQVWIQVVKKFIPLSLLTAAYGRLFGY